MSIEKFLNDLDKQDEEFKQKQKSAEEARQKIEADDAAFLQEFNKYYARELTRVFRTLKEKLKKRFDFVYDKSTSLQQFNTCEAKVQISPKFDTSTKIITVLIFCEAGRRLITISSRVNERKDGLVAFQDTFDKFKELDIDEEIAKVLEKYLLKKM
jgi:hypothetical protein